MDIQPIPTRFDGHLFRSRIEARWAVFFKVLGIKCDYEPEKYETTQGRYIPDFRLPCGQLVEIKGTYPSLQERAKADTVNAMIFYGGVGQHPGIAPNHWPCCKKNLSRYAVWMQCIWCGSLGCTCPDHVGSHNCPNKLPDAPRILGADADSPMLRKGYETARSARFESPDFQTDIEKSMNVIAMLRELGVFVSVEKYKKMLLSRGSV